MERIGKPQRNQGEKGLLTAMLYLTRLISAALLYQASARLLMASKSKLNRGKHYGAAFFTFYGKVFEVAADVVSPIDAGKKPKPAPTYPEPALDEKISATIQTIDMGNGRFLVVVKCGGLQRQATVDGGLDAARIHGEKLAHEIIPFAVQ